MHGFGVFVDNEFGCVKEFYRINGKEEGWGW